MQRKLIVLAVLFVIMAIITFDLMAQSPQTRDHSKLQKENSFEVRLKANESFTLASAKNDLKTAKKNNRKSKKSQKDADKVLAIREKINEIKE